MSKLICLGVESTAHTFGIGIVDKNGSFLANEKSVYVPKPGKGMIPRDAVNHHFEIAVKTVENALKKAKIKLEDVNLVAVSIGPGLPPCLHVGATFARFLSQKLKIPLVEVNHCVAHIEIGRFQTKASNPVVLYLSGGNTQVIAFTEGKYRIFGETEDIPVGNAFDVVARELNLPMPGGAQIENLAKGGKYIELPYVVKGMDLSFTGIVTEAVKKIKSGVKKEDVCFSLQETCFAMLTEVTERALAHTDKKEVLLVGGVAANKRLQGMLNIMCEDRKAKFFVVPNEYCSDNGAMIAWTGLLTYKNGQKTNLKNSNIKPRWRTDEVDIAWI